jgi:hypothetical protein
LNFAREDAVLQLVDAWESKALWLRRKLALVIPNGVCGVRNLSGVSRRRLMDAGGHGFSRAVSLQTLRGFNP